MVLPEFLGGNSKDEIVYRNGRPGLIGANRGKFHPLDLDIGVRVGRDAEGKARLEPIEPGAPDDVTRLKSIFHGMLITFNEHQEPHLKDKDE